MNHRLRFVVQGSYFSYKSQSKVKELSKPVQSILNLWHQCPIILQENIQMNFDCWSFADEIILVVMRPAGTASMVNVYLTDVASFECLTCDLS